MSELTLAASAEAHGAEPHRTLRLTRPNLQGKDVEAFQRALNQHLVAHAQHHDQSHLAEDGLYGPATRAAYRWVGFYALGLPRSALRRGATETAQRLARDPSQLSDADRRRAKARQRELRGDASRPAKPGYPLGRLGTLIGGPGQGTHSWHVAPNNWQSDRAIDIGVPQGTPVFAVTAGEIGSRIGPLDSDDPRFGGIRLYVEGNGNSWYYAHLASIAPGIAPGVRVRRGALLGRSGVANGVAHLHLACQHGDPRSVL
jgi:murein DD-endopeptidase MepM/ murein hydrolase activator NlpD